MLQLLLSAREITNRKNSVDKTVLYKNLYYDFLELSNPILYLYSIYAYYCMAYCKIWHMSECQ